MIAVVVDRLRVDAKVVSWFENARLTGPALARAVVDCCARMESVNGALFKLERHAAEATPAERAAFSAQNLSHVHCVVETGPARFRNLRDGLFARVPNLASGAAAILSGLDPLMAFSMYQIEGDNRTGVPVLSSVTIVVFSFRAEEGGPESAVLIPETGFYVERVEADKAAFYESVTLALYGATEISTTTEPAFNVWFSPIQVPVDDNGLAAPESALFL